MENPFYRRIKLLQESYTPAYGFTLLVGIITGIVASISGFSQHSSRLLFLGGGVLVLVALMVLRNPKS